MAGGRPGEPSIDGGDELPRDVREAIHAGRTVEAVKRLREAQGLGLRAAREAVDAYSEAHRERTAPPRRGTVSTGSGIGRLLLVTLVVAALLAVYRFLT